MNNIIIFVYLSNNTFDLIINLKQKKITRKNIFQEIKKMNWLIAYSFVYLILFDSSKAETHCLTDKGIKKPTFSFMEIINI